MKNIFKVMGLALVAGSLLFVSCKKDDETFEDGVKVNFAGSEWTAASVSATVANDYVTFFAEKTAGNYPQVAAVFKADDGKYSAEMGTEEAEDEDGKYYELTGTGNKLMSLKYFEKEYLLEGAPEANWWVKTADINITEFDADAKIFSGSLDATMFDYENWDSEVELSNASTKHLRIECGKVQFK